jgi:type I restriction enzyme R subunit
METEDMEPEKKARVKIDKMFAEAGWRVVDRDGYAPNMSAVAIREGMLANHKRTDYFLFVNGKAVGVLEAKREEIDVSSDSVSDQAVGYARNVPNCYQAYSRPLPFIYRSNGRELLFDDYRDTEAPTEVLKRIHTPKEICKMLGIKDYYAQLPMLNRRGLRNCQYEAITSLEDSFRTGQNRALIVLATGAGKTYAACLAAYRMLSYTPTRRILFLVDRNNLGKQAENEFGTFRLTENGEPFNTIYDVNRLKSAKIPSESNVVISTIQRLYSLLTGQEITDTDEEENEVDSPVSLTGNLQLSSDFFDLIIIDECHRSIYGNWKSILDYFSSAKMIGLTATPIPETVAFFNNNIVVNYTLEKSIVDGVNVDARIYCIKTQVTENGGAILAGDKVKHETKYTGTVEEIRVEETRNYTKSELNRSVINPAQIKLVLETYRNAVYDEMFVDPQREKNFDYLPKTLIFALNEKHANNIVKIAKEVFERTDDTFVQKITYSAGDSNELIRQFRNSKDFRIAVTCTLVATGTDVKPLEVVMFMRDVQSEPLFVQMKGRGVRTIDDAKLQEVTPNAISKDCYFLVDAVGVTEHVMTVPTPANEPTSKLITFKELLEKITHGNVSDEFLRLLAAKLARIYNKADSKQRLQFVKLANADMRDISTAIFSALESGTLPLYDDINAPNIERKGLVINIVNHPEARKYLLVLCAGFVDELLPGTDTLISAGFSNEDAKTTTSAFEAYCEEHADEIEALRIIYNNEEVPITYAMLKDLEAKLCMANGKFTKASLWNSYALLNPANVRKNSTREERDALTNIIQLVRYAYHKIDKLESLYPSAQQRFNLWFGQHQRDISEHQIEIIRRVVDYIASNGACSIKEIKDDDATTAAQLLAAFGGSMQTNEALASLSQFILYRKSA